MSNYDGLKVIFDHEMSLGNLPIEVSAMMNYIVSSEANYDAFHSICAFLMFNHRISFMRSIGIKVIELRIPNEDVDIPLNKMN